MPAFTKQHYEAIAAVIRHASGALPPSGSLQGLDKDTVVMGLADLFARDNERFDLQRFVKACSR